LTSFRVSRSSLQRHFYQFLDKPPSPELLRLPKEKEIYLKIDGSYFRRWGCVLVHKADRKIIFWDFTLRENYFSYCLDFAKIKELGYKILGTISDWHGGLMSALKSLFPDIPHQRCLVHTQRFCQSLLTQRPETEAGIRLLEIVKFLNQIKNKNEKEIWIKWLSRFERRYLKVINERTYAEDKKHWWHTHKNLRRAFRTLRSSIDNLFLYLDFPDLPKDTNGLEAEFSHLKRKLSLHRGLKRERKISLIKWYFYLKSKERESAENS